MSSLSPFGPFSWPFETPFEMQWSVDITQSFSTPIHIHPIRHLLLVSCIKLCPPFPLIVFSLSKYFFVVQFILSLVEHLTRRNVHFRRIPSQITPIADTLPNPATLHLLRVQLECIIHNSYARSRAANIRIHGARAWGPKRTTRMVHMERIATQVIAKHECVGRVEGSEGNPWSTRSGTEDRKTSRWRINRADRGKDR